MWITGISSAGKTSVAHHVRILLSSSGRLPIVIDGDLIRHALGGAHGHDLDSRRKMAFIYARLSRILAAQGHDVVCATISLFKDVHRWNRQHLDRYIEVLLDVPLEVARDRDTRGVYSDDGAEAVGVGLPAEYPTEPDIVISNHGSVTPLTAAQTIVDHFWSTEQ